MNQTVSPEWSITKRIIFRLAFCYLIFYFLFLSNFFVVLFPIVEQIHKPFQFVSDNFIGLINEVFISRKYNENIYKGLGDTSWFAMASLSFFVLAILITTGWSIFDKRKSYLELYTYLQTYSRYYLAFSLLVYGIDKLYEHQFPVPSHNLMQLLGNIDSHTLLWTFMGSSRAYSFFGGLVEVIAGLLLLFRRTTSLGALIALGSLTNILIIDIAYDTLVKSLVFHLVLINVFILSPDVKVLFKFFISKPNISLTVMPVIVVHKRFKAVQTTLKFILIAYVLFTLIKFEVQLGSKYDKPVSGGIDGIFEINEFFWNQRSLPPLTTDTIRWRRILIDRSSASGSIQFMDDTTNGGFLLNQDTTTHSLALTYWNDSTFRIKLHYSISPHNKYQFQGIFKNDSVHFSASKLNVSNMPLLRDRGRIKWVWW